MEDWIDKVYAQNIHICLKRVAQDVLWCHYECFDTISIFLLKYTHIYHFKYCNIYKIYACATASMTVIHCVWWNIVIVSKSCVLIHSNQQDNSICTLHLWFMNNKCNFLKHSWMYICICIHSCILSIIYMYVWKGCLWMCYDANVLIFQFFCWSIQIYIILSIVW
jgi:hypothetical protein